jgi:hypothetical protein
MVLARKKSIRTLTKQKSHHSVVSSSSKSKKNKAKLKKKFGENGEEIHIDHPFEKIFGK